MTYKKMKRLSINPFVRKVTGIMLTILAAIFVCAIILVGVLLAYSPGKLAPFLDENGSPLAGSISEKVFVNINGVEQGMFIMKQRHNASSAALPAWGKARPSTFLLSKPLRVLKTISLLFGGNSVARTFL